MTRQIVRSHKGRTVDMGAIKAKNGLVRAAGNSKMNARGDLLGPGGKIIKTKEQIASEYNTNNPKAVDRTVSLNKPVKEMLSGTPEAKTDVQSQIDQTATRTEEKPKSDIDSLKKFDVGVVVNETDTKK